MVVATWRLVFEPGFDGPIPGQVQVGGELYAAEVEPDCLGETVREQSLGGSRRAFEQNMPAGEQRHEHQLDTGFLPNDRLADLGSDRLSERPDFIDFHRCTSWSQ